MRYILLHTIGLKLKGLADAAENYHVVLAENRRLYNEVQDLKGIFFSLLMVTLTFFFLLHVIVDYS